MADLLLKQVVAVIDNRTTTVCLHAAGQIRPLNQPFDTLLGEQDEPPFHVHCRSMVIPWMAGFVSDIRAASNTELLKRPLKQRRIGPGGETGPLPPKAAGPNKPPTLPRGVSRTDAEAAAKRVLDGVKAAEPKITRLLKGLAATHDGALVGLEFRVKEHASLSSKLMRDARDWDGSVSSAANAVSDALRYTAQLPEETYAAATRAMLDTLVADGYKVRVKNSWDAMNRPYRGINVAVVGPDGTKFELQFHTEKSFTVKNGPMHDLYAVWRESTDPKEQARLERQMWRLAKTIPLPPGATGIQ